MAKFNMCSVHLMLSTIIAIMAKGEAQRYQEVFVNDYVSMRCSPNGSIPIQWHHNSDLTYVYAGGRLRDPYDSRFLSKKDNATGEYELIIPNATLQDAGWYYCSGEISGTRISSTQLTVLHVNPECSSNISPRGFVGPNTCDLRNDNMTFSCDVSFSGRAPYVIWRSANDSQTFCSSSCEVKSNRSICNLTFRADPLYDGSVFICDAITSSGRRFSCNSEIIKVWYLSADYENSEKRIRDSTRCAVRSNLNVQYKWTLEQNSERIFLGANQTIRFQQPGIHQCEVEYSIQNATCSSLVKNVTVDAEDKEQSTTTQTASVITISIVSLVCIALIVGSLIYILKRKRLPAVRKDSPLTEKEKSAIDNNRETLLSLINPAILIDLLEKEGAISKSELASIPSKSTSRVKNETLLKILKKGNLQLYWQTISSLRQSNQSHVAEILETGGFSVECLPADIDGNEPFSRYVYIGFSPEDKETVDALIKQLRNNGINCYLPPLDSDKHARIQNGVNASKKCLLLWPSKYVKKEWYELEKTAVLRKVELFGRDTLIIVKSKTKQKVPKGLKGFNEIVLNKEQLDASLIAELVTEIKRAPRGIMKFGLADGYFYGYLNIVLRGFRKRLTGGNLTEAPLPADCLPNTLKKLLIIFPESCICPSSIVTDGKIEFHKVVKFGVNRAGKIRDYANSLYTVKEGTEEYYFAGEFAASISTLYDAFKLKEEFSEMTEEQLHDERNVFFYSLKTILNQPQNAALKDQVKLVYWSDPASKNPKKVDLHKCLMEVIRKEINSEQTLDYPMYKRPRGKCLIIRPTTIHSKQGDVTMAEEKDSDILQKLFEDLYFEIEIYRAVDSNAINKALAETKAIDHSSYDAFVCCILSRGIPGEIYTNDGKQMRVLDIAENFSDIQCPSLRGKPKMFFIQTFQPGESYPKQTVSSPTVIKYRAAEQELEKLLPSDADTRSPIDLPVSDSLLLLPGHPDFLMSYSRIPGDAVYRNDGSASRYINALDECLRKGNEVDLALNEVTAKVRKELEARTEFKGEDLSKWLPFHRVSATRRRIYL